MLLLKTRLVACLMPYTMSVMAFLYSLTYDTPDSLPQYLTPHVLLEGGMCCACAMYVRVYVCMCVCCTCAIMCAMYGNWIPAKQCLDAIQ